MRLRASVVTVLVGACSALGCSGLAEQVGRETSQWGSFQQVQIGDVASGTSFLPAPVREGHCYRVVFATSSGAPAQLAFQGQIDADSVGFSIHTLEARAASVGEGSITVFGFCSQGTGTIQLRATLPAPGQGALLEAPFNSLGPNDGADVVATHSWLEQRAATQRERAAEQERARIQAAMEQFVANVRDLMMERLEELTRSRGRYRDHIINEVRAGTSLQESLVLEPGRCYLFALLPYQSTALDVDLRFSVIRNAAERSDEGGGPTYSVCTASNGPVQEVSFSVQARIPPSSQHPPVYAVRVTHRAQSSAERRAANAEWLANDPEARIE